MLNWLRKQIVPTVITELLEYKNDNDVEASCVILEDVGKKLEEDFQKDKGKKGEGKHKRIIAEENYLSYPEIFEKLTKISQTIEDQRIKCLIWNLITWKE